jgi:hypothetical protein
MIGKVLQVSCHILILEVSNVYGLYDIFWSFDYPMYSKKRVSDPTYYHKRKGVRIYVYRSPPNGTPLKYPQISNV